MRARLHVRRAAAEQDGFTLPEMLVVLAIIGVILAGITQLFMSAMNSQQDQTNRTQAQQDARLGLDKLRREIRCANSLTTPSGYPASAITIKLGSYCPTAGGADATVTWCTKDKNGASPPVAGAQPYTLWRYTGSACGPPGSGTKWASNLVNKVDSPSILDGRIFGVASVPAGAAFVQAPTLTSASPGGTLASGTYSYDVTAVLPGGVEIPGTVGSVMVASGLTNQITVNWPAYSGATSYNVYGRDGGGLRLLKNVTSSPYVDTGPTKLSANPQTIPATGAYDVPVDSTSSFNAGPNTIVFGASGTVTCTGIASTPSPPSFSGCTGGQAGQYPRGMPVFSASSARPPRATLTVSLPFDLTPANANQRFVLIDNIVLRNSQPF